MSRKHLKRYLMLLSAVGLLAIGTAGSGTFASFSAEVASPNNYFATGTLFLHATKGSTGAPCRSEVVSDNANILSANGCEVLFDVPNLAEGDNATVNLRLDNAGSIDASALKFALGASGCVPGKTTVTTITPNATLAGATSINIDPVAYPLVKGTELYINDGAQSDTVTLSSDASANAPSIAVTGAAHPHGAGVKMEWNRVFGSGNLCSGLFFNIQEKTTNWAADAKCLFGGGTGPSCNPPGAQTVADITTTPNPLTNLWQGGPNGLDVLDAGQSRFITINIKGPASVPDNNQFQNRSALFDLLWRIESS